MRIQILPVAVLLLVSGCLPTCQKREPVALFPADSLSRALAQTVPVDTLVLAAQEDSLAGAWPLDHPRTLRQSGNYLYVSDTGLGNVVAHPLTSGTAPWRVSDFDHPYLGGFAGDTVVVYEPASGRITRVVRGMRVDSCRVPPQHKRALTYLESDSRHYYLKSLLDSTGNILVMDTQCRISGRLPLNGAAWQHAGLLRLSGDTVISLAAYRPAFDRVMGSRRDTLTLVGFDSPMLARRRAYLTGEVKDPPLLTPSAIRVSDRWYVLNARPGTLRVDVYGPTGTLERVFVSDHRGLDLGPKYFPTDLAVRIEDSGTVTVWIVSPGPPAVLETWRYSPRQ